MVTSLLRSKYLIDCTSWLRVCSKSQLQSYTACQQSLDVTLCSACRHNLHMYVKPTRVCTTYTCMYRMPSTAATHIEDLPIKQLPLNALEKLLKGPKFLTVHIVLLRGTPHRCHHSVSQLPGAGVELHTLHYCISIHRHHIHCMLVSHCLC